MPVIATLPEQVIHDIFGVNMKDLYVIMQQLPEGARCEMENNIQTLRRDVMGADDAVRELNAHAIHAEEGGLMQFRLVADLVGDNGALHLRPGPF